MVVVVGLLLAVLTSVDSGFSGGGSDSWTDSIGGFWWKGQIYTVG